MLQIKSPILNLFLFVLGISFNLSLDASYKGGEFSKVLLKKNLKFLPNRRDGTIIFNLSLLVLLIKVDYIPKNQSCKGYTLGKHGIGHVKIVFALLTKIIAIHIRAIII